MLANPFKSLSFNTNLIENEPYGFYTSRSYNFVLRACTAGNAGGNCANIAYTITFRICENLTLSLAETGEITSTRYIPAPNT